MRGNYGNPEENTISEPGWTEYGPFELSPERSRFGLTYSLVENGSFHFSVPVARFILPDLGFHNGHYVSLFAPGVSFLTIPGYLVGKAVSISQVGAYATIALFALINALLVKALAEKLGAHPKAAFIASIMFLFATPGFAYAVSLYQHQISVFYILLSLYAIVNWHSFWSAATVWFLSAASISIDYPNFFMMLPLMIFTLLRLIRVKAIEKNMTINLNLKGILAMVTMLIPIAFFLWSNFRSFGNPFQLAGTVQDVREIDEKGLPVVEKFDAASTLSISQETRIEKSTFVFFKTRNILRGLAVHLISPDRGVIFYTPVVLFGIFGAAILNKKRPKITALLLSIIGINLILYSMWGDPWGGWAFGSRYLIPSYAMLSIFSATAVSRMRQSKILLAIFFFILSYSIAVNALGAITTNSLPPKEEAIILEQTSKKEEKYTFVRNWDYLNTQGSKSFVFNQFAKGLLGAREYYFLITLPIIASAGISLVSLKLAGKSQITKKI